MKDASQYPVTTPFGQVPGYPLNNGFHNGIDYGCPVGTPIVVNGVQIGLSGNTGYSSGPHCHVGRWVGGKATNPVGGFTFNDAKVTEVSEDPTNGKFVRVQADGASWVYLHMSQQTATVGQVLKKKGNDMFPNEGDIKNFYDRTGWPGHPPNQNDIAYWTTGTGNDGWGAGADNVWKDLIYSVTKYVLENPAKGEAATPLAPGKYQVN